MEISLYKNQYPTGSRKSIQFCWEFGKLKIRTYAQHIMVSDGDIDKRDGKYFITPRSLNRHHNPAEIEIPVNVIEQFEQLNTNLKNSFWSAILKSLQIIGKQPVKCIGYNGQNNIKTYSNHKWRTQSVKISH